MKRKGLYYSDACYRCGDYHGTIPCYTRVTNNPHGGVGLTIEFFAGPWGPGIIPETVGYAVHLGDKKWVGIYMNDVAAYYGAYGDVAWWLQKEAGVKLDHSAVNTIN